MQYNVVVISCGVDWALVDVMYCPLAAYWDRSECHTHMGGRCGRGSEGGRGSVPCGSTQREAVEHETGVLGMGGWVLG